MLEIQRLNDFDGANSFRLDRDCAEKLRYEHPEQYNTLLRMHLSFELSLDLYNESDNADNEKKHKLWRGFKKAKGCATPKNSPPETASSVLTEEFINQLMVLMKFLQLGENISQEGIFRKTGSVSRQQELKNLINQLKPFKLADEYTSHDVASVLKSLLADLPEPLLTEVYYPAYCQVAEICNLRENDGQAINEFRILNSLQLLFLLLPKENQVVMEHLTNLLNKTSQLESQNKMNADTLATLFTPHLICPRKLSPEVLHQTAATMTSMISFIIRNNTNIFRVPEKLSTDIRAYFVEKRRKTMSPERILDESVSDSVVNTVYTFVDREKTAEAHISSTTDTALAQLYAYIQSLPESSKKKKLIKQFNKENGHGTPLQVLNREKPGKSTKSIGDSIKKHIFHKNLMHKTPKKASATATSNTPTSASITSPITFQTPNAPSIPKTRVLFQTPNKPASLPAKKSIQFIECNVVSPSPSPSPINATSQTAINIKIISPVVPMASKISDSMESNIEVNLEEEINQEEIKQNDHQFLSDDEDFCSSAGSSMDNLDQLEGSKDERCKSEPNLNRNESAETENDSTPTKKVNSSFKNKLLKGVSLGNLRLPLSPLYLKKAKSSSQLQDKSAEEEDKQHLLSHIFEMPMEISEEDLKSPVRNNWSNLGTPKVNFMPNRNSMSPITKSTQRMPKFMQESIMTPRSRKPVMLMGAFNSANHQESFQSNFENLLEETDEPSITEVNSSDGQPIETLPTVLRSRSENDITSANDNGLPLLNEHGLVSGGCSSAPESLTSNFKDYLYTRSVLSNSSPDDLSFSSLPNDFDSSNDDCTNQTVDPEQADAILNNLNESDMSESMLFCLNGNNINSSGEACSPGVRNPRKRMYEDNDQNEQQISKHLAPETNL